MTDTVNVPLLWSMHILGPDDMYPAPDLATAFKWCEYVNSELAPRTPDVLLVAIPVLWDGSPEQHAKSLPDAIKGWTVPAQPEAQKGETVDEEIGEEYDIAAHCVTLAECPAGLFFWNGSLGFKSEYGAMEPDETSNGKLWRVSNRPDAYCADSGEYFWGGTSSHDDRAKLLVYPISAETVAMVASHGPDALAHPAPASDELLEALKPFADAAEDLDDGEAGHIWERPAAMSIDASDLRRASELYAKHKGPQS